MSINDYKSEVAQDLQSAWEVARQNVEKAQKRQKKYYDRHAREVTYKVGQRVFLYTPSAKSGQSYKFALPYKGPFRILGVKDNVAEIQNIDQPTAEVLRVALSRLRHCPKEIEMGRQNELDSTEAQRNSRPLEPPANNSPSAEVSTGDLPTSSTNNNLWGHRLRRRQSTKSSTVQNSTMPRTASKKDREM